MPGYDGTGPLGRGPMTGWRRGWCMAGRAPMPEQGAPQAAGTETQGQTPVQPAMPEQGPIVYGRGRGGIPWGCGRGFEGGMRGGRMGPRCGGWRWRY